VQAPTESKSGDAKDIFEKCLELVWMNSPKMLLGDLNRRDVLKKTVGNASLRVADN